MKKIEKLEKIETEEVTTSPPSSTRTTLATCQWSQVRR
jgi:hypothetical protein